jgi:hypothetical protein
MTPLDGASPVVVHAPGFAGGRLLLWNQLLRAVAVAQAPGPAAQVRLILDDNLTTRRDLRLPVQNDYGDVVHIEIPDHGKLGCGSRIALAEALLDSLPPTAELQPALDLVLPEALQTPLEAARDLWSRLFPQIHIETIRRGAPSPPRAQEIATRPTGITWLSARHQAAQKELGLSTEALMAGEAVCKQALPALPAGELGEALEKYLEEHGKHLEKLKRLAEEVDVSLVGAWLRMRRDVCGSLEEFAERADRCGRNRVGIRNARLHALAQAVRPHDNAQESGLSFLSAIASYQLNWQDFSGYLTTLKDCSGQENVQIGT